MSMIEDASAARRLREQLLLTDNHQRIRENRKVVDRAMDVELSLFKNTLAEDYQASFVPFQDPEPADVKRKRKHILASNAVEIEVIAKAQSAKKLAQEFEEGLEALEDALFPPLFKVQECDGIFDGRVIICVERKLGEELKGYGNRDALRAYAEQPDEAPEDEAPEEATATEDEPKPPAPKPSRHLKTAMESYRKHYSDVITERAREAGKLAADPMFRPKRRPTDPHDEAYQRATEEAMMYAELPWTARIVDLETFWAFEPTPGEFTYAMEDGYVPMNPAIRALADQGIKVQGGRWVRSQAGATTDDAAYGMNVIATNSLQQQTGDETLTRVRWTRIATNEEVVILVEHPNGSTADDPGELLRFPNQMAGRSTGYYQVAGDVVLRATAEERYLSPIQPIIVMARMRNYAVSAAWAMAAEEAMRGPYRVSAGNKPSPVDTTQDSKAALGKAGTPGPTLRGGQSVERVPTTGMDVLKFSEMLENMSNRYRDTAFYAGEGGTGEAGVHLARLQTAFLTDYSPYQDSRAMMRKDALLDICYAEAEAGRTLHVPYQPKGTRGAGEGTRVAEPRKITPEMSMLPVDVQIKIGAESPETRYAQEQAARANEAAGVYGMTRVRELIGVKDPAEEERQLAIDTIVQGFIRGDGQTPGILVKMVQDKLAQRIQQRIDAALPAPPAAGPPPPVIGEPSSDDLTPNGPGNVPDGAARFNPPIQTENGVPVAAGLPGHPV